jgi:hypothetical protein
MKPVPHLALAVCLVVAPLLGSAEVVFAADRNDVAITLSGSRQSMLRQNRIAREEAFSFLRTPTQVLSYVERGNLVPLPGNEDYAVIAGYPFARPVVRSFIERLAAGYRDGCGERMVVTSLTRPSSRQPSNASPLSVHPAGMAVDLRYPANVECRSWIIAELLRLETEGVIDATLERTPPHFHVAVFPARYAAYEQRMVSDSVAAEAIRLLEEAVAARDAAYSMDADGMDAAAAAEGAPAAQAASLASSLVRAAVWLARRVLPVAAAA